ncbi:MAG: ATP-binding protein [Hyphomicrobiales bacterium]|jgi:two-component system, OmpR family, phosphate regulon sensor histidine kinase PhoR|nr:ATP-binding protein [Hyphomicrobiales bacterium]
MLKKEQLISVLEIIEDGIIIISSNFDVQHANKKAIEYFGKRIIGKPIYSFIRSNKLIEVISEDSNINTTFQYNGNLNKQSLELTYLQTKGQPGAIVIKDRSKEEAFENIRRDLVANVSHELRSPLTAISGFIETLKSDKIDRKKELRFLQIMEEESNRMTRLLADLLSLSKLEINMHSQPNDKINLIDQVNVAKDALDLRANDLGKKILIEQSDLETYIIKGEADEIIEVFHNLIDNAIKYSNKNSDIYIKICKEMELNQNKIKISVINEGKGISEEHLPRLTERFYRVDMARSRSIGGTGLGLAIVKHILIRHNAQMTIASEVDGKTTFSVSFPVNKV